MALGIAAHQLQDTYMHFSWKLKAAESHPSMVREAEADSEDAGAEGDDDCDYIGPAYGKAAKRPNSRVQKKKTTPKPWSEAETEKLLLGVKEAGGVSKLGEVDFWKIVSKSVLGREPKQCRERYTNHHLEDINKGAWTAAEEYTLARCHSALGNQWAKIWQHLQRRSTNGIKNKWFSTSRCKGEGRAPSLLWTYTQHVQAAEAKAGQELSPQQLPAVFAAAICRYRSLAQQRVSAEAGHACSSGGGAGSDDEGEVYTPPCVPGGAVSGSGKAGEAWSLDADKETLALLAADNCVPEPAACSGVEQQPGALQQDGSASKRKHSSSSGGGCGPVSSVSSEHVSLPCAAAAGAAVCDDAGACDALPRGRRRRARGPCSKRARRTHAEWEGSSSTDDEEADGTAIGSIGVEPSCMEAEDTNASANAALLWPSSAGMMTGAGMSSASAAIQATLALAEAAKGLGKVNGLPLKLSTGNSTAGSNASGCSFNAHASTHMPPAVMLLPMSGTMTHRPLPRYDPRVSSQLSMLPGQQMQMSLPEHVMHAALISLLPVAPIHSSMQSGGANASGSSTRCASAFGSDHCSSSSSIDQPCSSLASAASCASMGWAEWMFRRRSSCPNADPYMGAARRGRASEETPQQPAGAPSYPGCEHAMQSCPTSPASMEPAWAHVDGFVVPPSMQDAPFSGKADMEAEPLLSCQAAAAAEACACWRSFYTLPPDWQTHAAAATNVGLGHAYSHLPALLGVDSRWEQLQLPAASSAAYFENSLEVFGGPDWAANLLQSDADDIFTSMTPTASYMYLNGLDCSMSCTASTMDGTLAPFFDSAAMEVAAMPEKEGCWLLEEQLQRSQQDGMHQLLHPTLAMGASSRDNLASALGWGAMAQGSMHLAAPVASMQHSACVMAPRWVPVSMSAGLGMGAGVHSQQARSPPRQGSSCAQGLDGPMHMPRSASCMLAMPTAGAKEMQHSKKKKHVDPPSGDAIRDFLMRNARL